MGVKVGSSGVSPTSYVGSRCMANASFTFASDLAGVSLDVGLLMIKPRILVGWGLVRVIAECANWDYWYALLVL